jgi:hypothetical protein
MANLLDGLDKLISDIAGPLVFTDASLIRKARIADGRGGFVESQAETPCKVLVSDYSAFARASYGSQADSKLKIANTDRKLLVLGYGLTPPPVPGNVLAVNGYRWLLVTTTSRDPASATFEFQGRPDGVYTPIPIGMFSAEFSGEFA